MMRIWVWLAAACVTEDFDGDGYVEPEDCNDNDAESFPGAEEVPYDFIDQDCDGFDLADVDGDGFDSETVGGPDCNDFRAAVNPAAEEIWYDGFDQNCDGWNDFDADFDGFDAQGYGGDDCDDTSPAVVPLDFDGDGATACTGDCDDNDPFRFPGADAICGNGVEDDCDGVSDCAPIGNAFLSDADFIIEPGRGDTEVGHGLALPGDTDGDLRPDVVVSGERVDGPGVVWWMSGPLPERSSTEEARTTVTVPGGVASVVSAGDLDDDGLGDVIVSYEDGDTAHVAVVPGGLDEGVFDLADVATLQLRTLSRYRLDPDIQVLGGDTLVIGAARAADGNGLVYLMPAAPQALPVALGDQGVVIEGGAGEGLGYSVAALDVDGDGAQDLVLSGLPDDFGRNTTYVVENPPLTGVQWAIDDIATARIDTSSPWRLVETATMADLDADGRADLVLGVPAYERRTGAVIAFTRPPEGEVSLDDTTVRIIGLGDQNLGERLVTGDHDGDGFLDLIIGAPSTFNESGADGSPGNVHVFYGPLEREQLVSLEDDWRMDVQTPSKDVRARLGFQVGMTRLDLDVHIDLVMTAPRLEGGGGVFGFRGGASAVNGI